MFIRDARSFCVVFAVFTYQKALAPSSAPPYPLELLGRRGAPLPHPPRDFLHIFNFHNGRTGSFIGATALPYSLMNNAESEPKSNGIGTNLPKQVSRVHTCTGCGWLFVQICRSLKSYYKLPLVRCERQL